MKSKYALYASKFHADLFKSIKYNVPEKQKLAKYYPVAETSSCHPVSQLKLLKHLP